MRIIAIEGAFSVPGVNRQEAAIRQHFAVPGPVFQEWFRGLAEITEQLPLVDMRHRCDLARLSVSTECYSPLTTLPN